MIFLETASKELLDPVFGVGTGGERHGGRFDGGQSHERVNESNRPKGGGAKTEQGQCMASTLIQV